MLRELMQEAIEHTQSGISCLVRLCAVKSAAVLGVSKSLGATHDVDISDIHTLIASHCEDMFTRGLLHSAHGAAWVLISKCTEADARLAIDAAIDAKFDDMLSPAGPAIREMIEGVEADCNRLALLSATLSTYTDNDAPVADALEPLIGMYKEMIEHLLSPEALLVQEDRLSKLAHRYCQLRAEGIEPDEAHHATVVETMVSLYSA